MKKLLVPLLVIAVVAAIAIPAWAVTKTVRVGDDYYVRDGRTPTVTVKRNTLVRWRWVGRAPHDVRVLRGPVRFRSAVKTSGTYSKRMRRRGTYTIYCTVHGVRDMSMKLRVT